jgi:hypothetical protein
MAYRSLLMPIDHGPLCTARTRFAVRLARDLEAHLSGIASTGLIELPGVTSGAAALAEFAAVAWDELRNHAEHACAHFKKDCQAAGFKDFDAWVSEGDPAATLLHQSHLHDLTVLSQPDPSQPGHAAAQAMVEQMVLFSPRPTLLLPYAGRFDGSCNTVMMSIRHLGRLLAPTSVAVIGASTAKAAWAPPSGATCAPAASPARCGR